MHVGYARVSTVEQSLALQQDALYGSGCELIFSDVAGGTVCERKGLAEALAYLRSGDTLVVWKLPARLWRRGQTGGHGSAIAAGASPHQYARTLLIPVV